jgi:hypothetical protein
MRATHFLLLLLLALPVPAQECGVIDRTGTTLTIGDAAGPGTLTIDECYGPGSPGVIPEPDRTFSFPEFTADWADMSHGTGDRHSTLTSQVLPGGHYTFTDYQVPAGVTLIYTGSVSIRAVNVRINGTVRTDSPGAGIQIRATQRFEIEGVEPDAAVIETRGADSPIEIGAQWGIVGKYRSQIIVEHGDILISSGDDDPGSETNLV